MDLPNINIFDENDKIAISISINHVVGDDSFEMDLVSFLVDRLASVPGAGPLHAIKNTLFSEDLI